MIERPYTKDFNPNKWLADLAAELSEIEQRRVPKTSLLAMSENKDHFNKGTPGDFKKAEWFDRVFRKYGSHGTHIKSLHYRYVSLPKRERVTWDGQDT